MSYYRTKIKTLSFPLPCFFVTDSMSEARTTFATSVKYRMHRKMFIGKIIKALDIYQERLLY